MLKTRSLYGKCSNVKEKQMFYFKQVLQKAVTDTVCVPLQLLWSLLLGLRSHWERGCRGTEIRVFVLREQVWTLSSLSLCSLRQPPESTKQWTAQLFPIAQTCVLLWQFLHDPRYLFSSPLLLWCWCWIWHQCSPTALQTISSRYFTQKAQKDALAQSEPGAILQRCFGTVWI